MIDHPFCLCDRILMCNESINNEKSDLDAIHQRVFFCKIYKFLYCKSHYLRYSSSSLASVGKHQSGHFSFVLADMYRNAEYHATFCALIDWYAYKKISRALSSQFSLCLTGELVGHCWTRLLGVCSLLVATKFVVQIRSKLVNYLAHWTWFLHTTTNGSNTKRPLTKPPDFAYT